MRRLPSVAACAVVWLLTACGAGPGALGSWQQPLEPPSSPEPGEITLAFAGDVHFVAEDGGVPNRTGALLRDPATAFGPIAAQLSRADLAMLNLETAVTLGGTPQPKRFHFRAPPAAYQALTAAGVDVVSLANNHALDYGREGLADTLGYAEAAGMPVVGAGRDAAAAYAPWVTELAGVRVGFVGLSQVTELWQSWRAERNRSGIAYAMDAARALAAVRAADQAADVVVVYLHWGVEGSPCPTPEMTALARDLAYAGADLVVGTHAHVLLGDGWLGGTFVQYGLGNFVWWRDDAFSNDTGVLWVRLRGPAIESAGLRPAVISRETGQPIPASGQDRDRILRSYEELRACTGLSPSPT